MKILFLMDSCEGLGIAQKLAEEGNSVQVFMSQDLPAGTGLVQKIDSWREYLVDTDLVVCNSLLFSRYEKIFKEYSKPYIGCSYLGKYLLQAKKREFIEDICGLTMCPNFEQKVMLHGFFNGRDWVRPLLISVIDAELFPGGIGPTIGSMGCVVKTVIDEPEFVDGLAVGLRKLGIRDFVSVPFSLKGGIFNVACGLVFDVLEAIAEGLRTSLGDVLFKVATGIAEKLDLSRDYMICVKVTIPPFPYSIPEARTQWAIEGLNEFNLKHIYLDDVCKTEDENYRACMDSGIVLKVTARGRDIREARRRVYRTIGNVSVESKQYRVDIGEMAMVNFATSLKGFIDGGKQEEARS
jgi:hypothetical protein